MQWYYAFSNLNHSSSPITPVASRLGGIDFDSDGAVLSSAHIPNHKNKPVITDSHRFLQKHALSQSSSIPVRLEMRNMASTASTRGIAAIVGVGPNLGRSIARKFAHEGYTVAILARDLGGLSRFADEIAREEKAQVFAIRIDCSDQRSVREAFEGVLSLGFVEVLVYNAYQSVGWSPSSFSDIRVDSFEKSIAVSSVGAFHCSQLVLPGMVERGKGTILFTGCSASLNGAAGFSELCCGKFALRALAQCLAREFQPFGIHVAHVIIDGVVGSPRLAPALQQQQRLLVGEYHQQHQIGNREGVGPVGNGSMDPDALAQTYWHLHTQDRAAWTQEIDLRPSNSRFF